MLKNIPLAGQIRGFTLPEVLITLGLLIFVIGIIAIAGNDGYQRTLHGNDVERFMGLLRRARSLSQAGACEKLPCHDFESYGVYVGSGKMTLFQGNEYSESKALESFALGGGLATNPISIVFLALSGRTAIEQGVRITNPQGQVRSLTIKMSGVIILESL